MPANGSATIAWSCTAAVPDNTIGRLSFSASASNGTATYTLASSNDVIVAVPLTFQVQVKNPAGVQVVQNQAEFTDGAQLITASAFTALSASIGDRVWADANGNGQQDGGELGLSGVKVYVDSNNNGLWDAGESYAFTDATGLYRIYGLSAATYTVRTDPATYPAGYLPTTPTVLSVPLSANQQYDLADFGLQPPPAPAVASRIGDTVWLDANNNGAQDNGELGLPGIKVKLYRDLPGTGTPGTLDGTDPVVATAITDANGVYSFPNLPAGTYFVQVDTASTVTSPYGGAYSLASALVPTYDEDNGTASDGIPGSPNSLTKVVLAANTQHLTADFGYRWGGSIGDYVWWDNNTNGQQDESPATPIANAVVNLYVDANGNGILDPAMGDYQVAFTTTNASGVYQFTNLPPGPYLVDVYEDSITTNGVRNIVPTTNDVVYKSLSAGETYLGADFGYYQGAKVEGNVFWDRDRNGLFDSGETGLGNGTSLVLVTLTGTDMLGNPISKTTYTDASGHFFFLVPEGNYTLTYNTSQTTGLGYPDATTATSQSFHAYPGEDWQQVFDFGVDNNGKIGDRIWNDADADGVQDTGELGIAGVTVKLYLDTNGDGTIDADGADNLLGTADDEPLVAVEATDASGNYLFEGLAATTASQKYQVVVDPANFLTGGVLYNFAQKGDPDQPGAVCTTCDNKSSTTLSNGGSVLDKDFGYQNATAQNVSGIVWKDDGTGGGTANDGTKNGTELGIQNVSVSLVTLGIINGYLDLNGDGQITAADDGTYGSYTVTDGVLQGVTDGTLVNNYPVYGGRLDVNASGGVNDSDDKPSTVVATDTTDATTGAYSFLGVPPGEYLIKVDSGTLPSDAYVQTGDPDSCSGTVPNRTCTTPGLTRVTVTNTDVTGKDFGYNTSFGSINGSVCSGNGNGDCNKLGDPSETGLAIVTVILTYAGPDGIMGTADDVVKTALTDANGNYTFSDLAPGLYQITKINPAGLTSLADIDGGNPNNISLTLTTGQTKSNQDSEVQPAAGSIGDSVWLDVDRDGVQDIGEPGLPNVSVALWSVGADNVIGGGDDRLVSVTTSDLQGNYLFTDVPAGKYYVKVDTATLPSAGLTETAGNVNSQTGLITLTGGQNYLDADFGYVPTTGKAVIGNFIWSDANQDGIQDPGEPGIGGVTVALKTTGGSTVATVTTGADGSYYFTNVDPGQYVVDVTDADSKLVGYSLTTGPQSSTDPTAPITVSANQTYDKADFGYFKSGLHFVADRVWFDADRDGTQDAGEAGIAGVSVNLYADLDGDGQFTKPVINGFVDINRDGTITNADNCTGCFLGYDIVAGVITSSGSPVTGIINGVAVISGRLDLNGDGAITSADDGRVVDEPIIATALSDDIGDFAFTGLPNGQYVMEIADNSGQLTGYQGTTVDAQAYLRPVTVNNADVTGVHFGYASLGPIGDTVFSDANGNGIQDPGESGIPGVTLVLYRDADNDNLFDPAIDVQVATQVTDGAGKYFFDNLVAGTYFVSVDNGQTALSGYTRTTTDQETGNQTGKVYRSHFSFRLSLRLQPAEKSL